MHSLLARFFPEKTEQRFKIAHPSAQPGPLRRGEMRLFGWESESLDNGSNRHWKRFSVAPPNIKNAASKMITALNVIARYFEDERTTPKRQPKTLSQ
jgi:hypothetical protein